MIVKNEQNLTEKGAVVYKTQGIILKKADLSETDRLLTIYTKNLGKILVRAKGINKKESKLKSLIEPFNWCEFMLVKSRTINVLAGSWPIKEFVYLRHNLENLAMAIYFAELVNKLVVAPERDDKIWALLVRVMEVLDSLVASAAGVILRSPRPDNFGAGVKESPMNVGASSSLVKIKTAFEAKLLEFLGYGSAVKAVKSEQENLRYLQRLAGEEINSLKFLKLLSLNR